MSAAFDKYSDSYGEMVERSIAGLGASHDFATRAKAALLADIIAKRHGTARPDILDVGCGVGVLHPHLRSVQKSLTGVDVSSESIAQAARAQDWARYQSFDGRRLPFDDARFDFTLAVCVLHHVPPEQHESFLAEMRRVTRPGGTVCAIEHNPLNPLTRLAVLRCPFDDDAVLLRAGYARKLFAQAGLSGIATQFFLAVPSLHPAARAVELGLSRVPLGAQYATCGMVA